MLLGIENLWLVKICLAILCGFIAGFAIAWLIWRTKLSLANLQLQLMSENFQNLQQSQDNHASCI